MGAKMLSQGTIYLTVICGIKWFVDGNICRKVPVKFRSRKNDCTNTKSEDILKTKYKLQGGENLM